MIRKGLFLAALALFASPLRAQEAPPSLFYTPQEVWQIETALRREEPALLAQAKHVLHCGSIMYVSADQWTVWLQGEKWTPQTDRPNLHIQSVEPDSVRLSILLLGEKEPREVTLRTNQSLNLLTGAVMEGIY
ncbi:MAG: hypothetical protein WC612_02515 [Bdellovibrionales bacterium]|jgi:hypothetical protein